MATTKKTEKKVETKKSSAKKVTPKKVPTKKKADIEKKGFFKSLLENVSEKLDHVTENVAEGASYLTEKVKETTAKAYVAGTELVEEANEKIHQFTDKQSLNKEKSRVEDAQNELVNKFGQLTLEHYLKNDSLHKTFLKTNEVNELVEEYKLNIKELKSIDKALDKLQNQ